MKTIKDTEFQVIGKNKAALFTLKLHRGEGMALLAMNWKKEQPPQDFVGFAIEYKEPGGDRFYAVKNRISFPDGHGNPNPNTLSSKLSPIQKFRWVHFPRNADMEGEFVYRVTPVFMNDRDELSYGEPQTASIVLKRETYPGYLNVTFTRGFVSSQSFVNQFETFGPITGIIPNDGDGGLDFKPTHPKAKDALNWMGFEARRAILDVLDKALADSKAQVRVVAYDLNEPDIVSRLVNLGSRLKIIIDDEGSHGKKDSAESIAADLIRKSAGTDNVKRQHMGNLQHNKTIVVVSPKTRIAVCGSTNFSWRGLFIQSNNALIIQGVKAIKPFIEAFENYWNNDTPKTFADTASAQWSILELNGINAKVGFSPHSTKNELLKTIAEDIETNITSNMLFSLAFLYQTKGALRDAITKVSNDTDIFVCGISDKKVGGFDFQKPNGDVSVVYSEELSKDVPAPFKVENKGGRGARMHHKFIVIDFDKPTARVYLGSYNFSTAADRNNGENLVLIHDRKIAVSYVIEAIRIFDHYHFRVAQNEAKTKKRQFTLLKPPRSTGETPWWLDYYTNARKIRERELFA